MSPASVKRPTGATVLAIVLGWLGVAGLLNSFVWWFLPTEFLDRASPQLQSTLRAVRTPTLSLIALAYGLSALAACVYLWRMRPQMRTAMSFWVVSVAAFGAYFSIAVPSGPTTWIAELAFFVPLAALVTGLWLYVAQLSKHAAL